MIADGAIGGTMSGLGAGNFFRRRTVVDGVPAISA
jgi:hypothetical protein